MSVKAAPFAPFVGKKFKNVELVLEQRIAALGWRLALHDPSSPPNIDIEEDRVNVYVDDDFVITKISVD